MKQYLLVRAAGCWAGCLALDAWMSAASGDRGGWNAALACVRSGGRCACVE